MGERKLGRAGAGEIVAVQGGHIVRSTGRKDRHSKVCTAKGPRDRRVRLAAHTAIQFYDVQDRLGYDRPSKAVDWLIKKAKSAIDELEKLPAWNPIAVPTERFDPAIEVGEGRRRATEHGGAEDGLGISDVSGEGKLKFHGGEDEIRRRSSVASNSRAQNLPPPPPPLPPPSSLVSDSIKFLFPFDGSNSIEACSSPLHFPRFFNPDFSSHGRDLKLSLQFQNPILLQNHYTQHQFLLSGIPLGFDSTTNTTTTAAAAAFPDHHHQTTEFLFQNLPSWNTIGDCSFNSASAHQLSGIEQLFSQRGPLQSSTTPSIRAWIDPIPTSMAAADHQGFIPNHHPPSLSGFQFPARIQGDEHHHHEDDGFLNKPSSVSSNSRC